MTIKFKAKEAGEVVRKNLRKAREVSGLSRPDVIKLLEVRNIQMHYTNLQYYESEASHFSAGILSALAQVYECRVGDFFDENGTAFMTREEMIADKLKHKGAV